MLLCDTCLNRSLPAAAKAGNANLRRVSGTWDFKWVPGTTIRIAIQEVVPNLPVDLQKGRTRLVEALKAWFPVLGRGGPNLSYEVLPGYLPAPAEPQLARSNPAALADMPFVEHDVLVSFAPLPVTIPETRERASSQVNFPRSELGSYARRTEYGVPTLFLGEHEGFKSEKPLAWLDSLEGRFTVVHEVGHVLGMAHEQQNPLLEKGALKWRAIAEMRSIAKQRNARTPPDTELDAFIAGEITDPWPGDTRFSDWRPPPVPDGNGVDFDSVMAKPVYRCFLEGNHGGKLNCVELAICAIEQAEFARLAKPTASDLAQLVAMYGEA